MATKNKVKDYWQSKESRTSAVIALVAVNLFPIFGVLYWGWEIFPIMLLYWSENVIVGFYNVLRLATCRPEEKYSWLGKIFFIPFFIVHYGGFTAGHGVFVAAIFSQNATGYSGGFSPLEILRFIVENKLFLAIAALFVSHGYSFVANYLGKGEYEKADVQTLMMQPYRRVIVLHITIIIGGFLMMALNSPFIGLLFFILFKTFMDFGAHVKEHRKVRRR